MSKTKKLKAAALRYDQRTDGAPRLVAKGVSSLAKRIIDVANEHNVPVHEDPELIEILSCLDLYQEIPPETYRVVAELLAFIYRIASQHQSESLRTP